MKKILITQRLVRDPKSGEERDCLDGDWALLIRALGMLPVPFPMRYPAEDFLRAMPCDALILSGGNDLDSVAPNPLSSRRDAVEKDLLSRCLARKLPVLGVCRGMELVAEVFGMRLEKIAGHVGVRKALQADPASRFRSSLDKLRDVNCFHDYAVAEVKAPFILSARSEDGVVKAMECPSQRIFCQMWHSEREHPLVDAELELLLQVLGE